MTMALESVLAARARCLRIHFLSHVPVERGASVHGRDGVRSMSFMLSEAGWRHTTSGSV